MAKRIQRTLAKPVGWSRAPESRTTAWPAAVLEKIERIQAEKSRLEWESGGQVAAAVQKFPLGKDNVGNPVELIAINVGGQKHQYRTTQLPSIDPQSTGVAADELTPVDVLAELEHLGAEATPRLICCAESLRVSGGDRDRLSSILWTYISAHRDDRRPEVLTAVGSAIRKYIAILDVSRMSEIVSLLEAGHREPLTVELELEVVKMVYRKFEANPPASINTEMALTARLWEMAQDYMRTRFILRENCATVASLAVEAIVAARGSEASDAVRAVLASPFAWFTEMVMDDLDRLVDRWRGRRLEAAAWCGAVIGDVRDAIKGDKDAGNAGH